MIAADGTPYIAVRMSERAAQQLAKACGEARNVIFDEIEVEGRPPRTREVQIMEWLDWASRWLILPEGRVVLPDEDQA